MAINPDTGEYTGNDLERLEEALDKFLCLGPVYATWRRLRTQDSNALIPSFTIEYQNLQGYCEHVSLMADDELSPVSESKEAPEVMRLGLDVYTANDGCSSRYRRKIVQRNYHRPRLGGGYKAMVIRYEFIRAPRDVCNSRGSHNPC